jgi:hypothetical protein
MLKCKIPLLIVGEGKRKTEPFLSSLDRKERKHQHYIEEFAEMVDTEIKEH